jgi:hypothetical protein
MPWVRGVIGNTRSSSEISSLEVKASKVACLRRADSDASFGMPVVPEVIAISTIRSGSGSAVEGWDHPASTRPSRSAIATVRTGRVFSFSQRSSCSPRLTGMGKITAPRSGIASSSATYCHTLGIRTPTTSPAFTPRAPRKRWNLRTCSSNSSNSISRPSHTAVACGRRRAFQSR